MLKYPARSQGAYEVEIITLIITNFTYNYNNNLQIMIIIITTGNIVVSGATQTVNDYEQL